MKRLYVKNLGPIDYCEVEIKPFNIITGKQSSGKSTIAKCVYFFLSLKDELINLVYEIHHPGILADGKELSIVIKFNSIIRRRFRELFGTNGSLNDGMEIRMDYFDSFYIKVSYDRVIRCSYSRRFREFIRRLGLINLDSSNKIEMKKIKNEIESFFDMRYSPVYIPAGRSFMTTMGNQFSYFYYMMDDHNKRLIDLCSRKYFELVTQLKPLFNHGYESLFGFGFQEDVIYKIQPLIKEVMGGEYFYSDGKEHLLLDNGKQIDINMASSGQQEALWIYNILLYYLIIPEKKFFIIEEPESNLFPESQKNITRFIGFVYNGGFPMLINTHSPYVLGELNNMIYAGTFSGKKQKFVQEIIDTVFQLKYEDVQSLFVENGNVVDCMDYDIKQIDNTRLDEISSVINQEFDRLLEIEGE